MGHYEGWDNVWCNDTRCMGWVCPRCEIFVHMNQEHNCELSKAGKRIQVLHIMREEREGSDS
jgi:hypothetical protein